MRRTKIMASVVVTMGLGVVACSSSPESVGASNEPLNQLTCAYHTLTNDGTNSATTSAYTLGCSGDYTSSSNGAYNETWCTNAFVWEITALDAGTCGGRIIDTSVGPKTKPADQTDCEDTTMSYYIYGLDTVNDIQYAYSSNVTNAACTWSSTFGCDCSGSTLSGIDLDNWPDGTGGTVSVEGIRIVGQVYNSNVGNFVALTESVGQYDYGTCCVHSPAP